MKMPQATKCFGVLQSSIDCKDTVVSITPNKNILTKLSSR